MKELLENALGNLLLDEAAKKKAAKKKYNIDHSTGKRKPDSWLYTQDCPHCDHRYEVHTHTKDADDCPECGEDVDDDEHKKCVGCAHGEQNEQFEHPIEEATMSKKDREAYHQGIHLAKHFADHAEHHAHVAWSHEMSYGEGHGHGIEHAEKRGRIYGEVAAKYGTQVAKDMEKHSEHVLKTHPVIGDEEGKEPRGARIIRARYGVSEDHFKKRYYGRHDE